MLLNLRLRNYAETSGRLLLRHWQWLLVAGLLVPGVPVLSIVLATAQALGGLLVAGHGPETTLAGVAAVQLMMLFWILPQRRTLTGGDDFARFASALPIPHLVRRSIDVTLLLLVDLLLLAALAIALASPPVAGATSIFAALLLLVTVLLVQLSVLERRPLLLGIACLADPPFVFVAYDGVWTGPLLITALFAAVWVLFGSSPGAPDRSRRAAATALGRPSRRLPLPPALRLQLQALAASAPATTLRLVVVFGLALGSDALVAAFGFDARALPTSVVAVACIALVLGGFYRVLRDVQAPVASFTATLPLPRHFWAMRDTGFVMLLGLVPLALVLFPLLGRDHVSATALAVLFVAGLVLLILLRLPLVSGSRLGPLLAILIAAGWTGSALAAVGV